ncbi:MAG TPA: hypothetical protein VGK25_10285 [Ignavibacteria bacterium]|jgi:hypothetical protein
MKKLLIITACFVFQQGFTIFGQDSACTSPENSQFDFWLGEWNLDWKTENNEQRFGTNVVSKILGGCVIEENFSTSDNSITGKSFSVYNPNKKIWQQTWVDNTGLYLDFTGGFEDGKMILSKVLIAKDGRKFDIRMVFNNIRQNEFWWHWEQSTDEGKTWSLLWLIHYKRK